MSSETRALSYTELAELFDMTVPSVRNMVRRRMWHRVSSNDPKTVRVLVPVDEIPSPSTKPANAVPDAARDGSPSATSASLAILAKHIEALQAELEPLRATAAQVAALNAALDAAHDDARRLREERDALVPMSAKVAALSAALDAIRDERDHLLTREHLRESRRWWRRLTG
jgi:hypothetical protein